MRYAVTLAVSLIFLFLLSLLLRYDLKETHPGGQSGGFGMVYRLDRWTGDVVGISGFDAEHINLSKSKDIAPKSNR